MASTDESTEAPGLRVHQYFPKVAGFAQREDGSRDMGSLSGPARIEARQQESRERMVAGAELKVLQEQLRWCYHKEGVNHYENCKGIADAYLAKLRVHDSWLLKVSARRRRGALHWRAPPPPSPTPPSLSVLPRQPLERATVGAGGGRKARVRGSPCQPFCAALTLVSLHDTRHPHSPAALQGVAKPE